MLIWSRNIIDNTNIKQKDIVRKLIIAQKENRGFLHFLPNDLIRLKKRSERKKKQKQKKLNF
jgi:hypothetical protein